MVEVVGTAPTSVMVITKFVYRRSWKTNKNNISSKINIIKEILMKKYLGITCLILFVILVSILAMEFHVRLNVE